MAATDGARTEDTEAIALETERLFIDVSRGLQAGGGGDTFVVPTEESPREQVYHSQQGITPATLLRLRLGGWPIYLTWAVKATLKVPGTLQCKAVLWPAVESHCITGVCWASHPQSGRWFWPPHWLVSTLLPVDSPWCDCPGSLQQINVRLQLLPCG